MLRPYLYAIKRQIDWNESVNGGFGNIVHTTTTKLNHLAETVEQIYGIQLTQIDAESCYPRIYEQLPGK